MKTPGVIDGVIVAIIISLASAATGLLLGGFTSYPSLFQLLLCGSSLIYLVYLLKRSDAKIGSPMWRGVGCCAQASITSIEPPTRVSGRPGRGRGCRRR